MFHQHFQNWDDDAFCRKWNQAIADGAAKRKILEWASEKSEHAQMEKNEFFACLAFVFLFKQNKQTNGAEFPTVSLCEYRSWSG